MTHDDFQQSQNRVLLLHLNGPERTTLENLLSQNGYQVVHAESVDEAVAAAPIREFDACVLELGPSSQSLDESIRTLADSYLPTIVIVDGARPELDANTLKMGARALRMGAKELLTRPFDDQTLLILIQRVIHSQTLELEVQNLRHALKVNHAIGAGLGSSPKLLQVASQLEEWSTDIAPVAICGERGTGREHLARTLHTKSPRPGSPFVYAGFQDMQDSERLESTLLRARGGSLAIEDAQSFSSEFQQRISGAVDQTRLIFIAQSPDALASLNSDLRKSIGTRVAEIPALRNRRDDIPQLVQDAVKKAAQKSGVLVPSLDIDLFESMKQYDWPGNMTELEQWAQRAVHSGSSILTADAFPPDSSRGVEFRLPPNGVSLGDLEKSFIAQALVRTKGVLGPAAQLLGISYKTLQYRIRKYELDREALSATELFADSSRPEALESPSEERSAGHSSVSFSAPMH